MQNKRRGKASRHCLEAAALGLEAASPLGLRPSLDREGTRRARSKAQRPKGRGAWHMAHARGLEGGINSWLIERLS